MTITGFTRFVLFVALAVAAVFVFRGTVAAAQPPQARTGAPPVPPQALLPPEVDLSIDMAPTLGRADAPLTLIEFSDFECPFCGRYTRETRAQLLHDYVDTGKVRYVFRNYPLERAHPHALHAAEAAECARQQNRFWEMHERLFANQEMLDDADLVRYAIDAGVNRAKFEQCLSSAATAAKIAKDHADGAAAGITGTPTFFVGRTMPGTKVHVLARIVGARPYASFASTLDELLAAAR